MEYTVVSSDSHIDMSWLPGDLFSKAVPARFKDAAPQVVPTDDGPKWVAEGKTLGVANSAGFTFLKPARGAYRRVDRMLDEGLYDGRSHVTDPDLRLKCMEIDGIDAEVIYGITGTAKQLKDPELVAAVYRIYNDWVNDFCATRPGRWYALAAIPVHDPSAAAAELHRVAKHKYIRGAEFMASAAPYPIYVRDGHWDSVWQAVAETGLPISFHVGGGESPVPPPPGVASTDYILDRELTQNELSYRAIRSALSQMSVAQWLTSIIMSGACEKYPKFRFVLGEAGAGWIPFVLGRLDNAYTGHKLDTGLKPAFSNKPSEYWFRQGATTFQKEAVVGKMAHLIGEDNIMWGSDFPHPDSVWPESQEVIADTLGPLTAAVRRKIIRDNGMRLYRIGQ